jgi:uncharacterized coiled-coil protein SlyX
MYSQTKFKKLMDNVNELKIDTTANIKISILETELAKANLTIKDLQSKLTALTVKVDSIKPVAIK